MAGFTWDLLMKSFLLKAAWILLFAIPFIVKSDDAPVIGVVDLIDNWDVYQDKTVRVKGYASMGFEACVLWPDDPERSRIPFEYWVWYSELGTGCAPGESGKQEKYGYVIIKGVFNKHSGGHLGMYNGTIYDATITWLDDSNKLNE